MGILIQNDKELETAISVLNVFTDSLAVLVKEAFETISDVNIADVAICTRIQGFLRDGVSEYGRDKNLDSSASIGEIKPLD